MARFVLIHGAWHAGWAWTRLARLLDGHRVAAIDLPGHGENRRDKAKITLDAYAQAVVDALAADDEPAILVGHSMGGIVISAAAELAPERIAKLVYVTAFLPRNGESLVDYAMIDKTSLVHSATWPDTDGNIRFDPARAVAALYGECAAEDAASVVARLEAQPAQPLITPLKLSAERFGGVAKAYVMCSRDRAISRDIQARMAGNWPCDPVVEIDTDHSPFLSRPEALAAHLLTIAR